jgi:hypothetical protein
LSGAYLDWQHKKLPKLGAGGSNLHLDPYADGAVSTLHLDAFLEGAKAYQRIMREAMDGINGEILE